MNDFLIQALMDGAIQAEPGGRIRALITATAEHCAQMADEHSPAAAWEIRRQLVEPTPSETALAARLSVLTS